MEDKWYSNKGYTKFSHLLGVGFMAILLAAGISHCMRNCTDVYGPKPRDKKVKTQDKISQSKSIEKFVLPEKEKF